MPWDVIDDRRLEVRCLVKRHVEEGCCEAGYIEVQFTITREKSGNEAWRTACRWCRFGVNDVTSLVVCETLFKKLIETCAQTAAGGDRLTSVAT